MAQDEFPCPACGFLVFVDPPGSFDICPICNWEDDDVQLRHPSMGGGANDESLVAVQRRLLVDHPLDVKRVKDFDRDPDWRPLSKVEAMTLKPQADEANPYYWRKRG